MTAVSGIAGAGTFTNAAIGNGAVGGEGPVLRGFKISGGNILRFGIHSIPLDQIASFAPVRVKERDVDSVLATVAVFMGAGAIFLLMVVELGWRERFLVAAGLFAAIAVAAIVDLSRTMQLNLYRLEIRQTGGERVEFVTPDRVTFDRLHHVLSERLDELAQRTALAAPVNAP